MNRKKKALKIQCCQKAIAVIDIELALLEKRFLHPEQFIVKPTFKSNLYLIPESDDGLGIIGFVELIVALFLLGGIYTKDGKRATLIQIANIFIYHYCPTLLYQKETMMEIKDNKFDNNMEQIISRLEELRELMKAKNRLNGETLLDNQDLCFMLHLSKRSLQRYRSSGQLPFLQIGQKIFYLESEIERFIQQHIDKRTDKESAS